ncbi:MAG: TIGR03084 family metal-binding protein [Hyphomicrobiaceae bacterium]
MSLQQVQDFREEAEELHKLLAALDDDDWQRETTFKHWTINDVVQHLHFSDNMALLSATDVDAYVRLRDAIKARRDSGATLMQLTHERIGHLTGRALLETWAGHWSKLCDVLAAKDPDERLTWSGPDMGVRMFVTARQMETWAHGQEIYDVLGVTRVNTDRIKNIAVIGVRTFGWTFANRQLAPPGEPPHVRLQAPSGETWDWNESNTTDSVIGSAVGFCQVVTQVRNVADTTLSVRGPAAMQWMQLAQCFAGPPETPPAPGTRLPTVGS